MGAIYNCRSLAYEWLFYAGLPLIAVALNRERRPVWITLSLLACLAIGHYTTSAAIAQMFLGGAIAHFLIRINSVAAILRSWPYAIISLISLGYVLFLCPHAYAPLPLFLLSITFVAIAAGNSFFGVLQSKVSQFLGEISYSIYLIHGIVLYVAINLLIGTLTIEKWNFATYGSFVAIFIAPILILICALTFRFIEHPGVVLGRKIEKRLRTPTSALIDER